MDVNYKYDDLNRMKEKSIGSILNLKISYLNHGRRTSNMIYYIYNIDGLLRFRYNENYFYLKNMQYDIIGILNEALEKIVTYEYDSWEDLISIKDSNNVEIIDNNHIGKINPIRYRSYYYDEETGFYYLNNRY